jgi:predicted metalloendopeptidase
VDAGINKARGASELAAVIEKIGYPDKWIDYRSLSITRVNYALNQMRASWTPADAKEYEQPGHAMVHATRCRVW